MMSRNSTTEPGQPCSRISGRAFGFGRLDVEEVHGLAVDLGAELRVGVELGLLRAPVEAVGPVVGQCLEVIDRHSALPWCARQLFGPARRGQPASSDRPGRRRGSRCGTARGSDAQSHRRIMRHMTGRYGSAGRNLDTDVTSGVKVKHEVFVVLCGTCRCPIRPPGRCPGGTC